VIHHIFDYPSAHNGVIIAAKTAVIYLFLIGGLRLMGKRELGQMNLYDLVMIVVLGNAVQNAMINNDNTLGGGIVAASVLLLLNRALNELVSRSKQVERLMVGEPVLIVHDGVVLKQRLEQQGLTTDQLDAALREHGIDRWDDVHSAVLEVDGSISVIPRQATIMKTRRHYRGLRLP
jgi:uncharacterized membrane protein YcaP (DUF421 family)